MSKKVSEERWKQAIQLVESKECSLRKAAAKFGVNWMSLQRRVKGLVKISGNPGPSPILSKSEKEAVLELIVFRAARGMCISTEELRHVVRQIALKGPNKSRVDKNFPNLKWMQRFIKDQPSISMRRGQLLEAKRASNSTVETIDDYATKLSALIEMYDPKNIWNCDETGVCPRGKGTPRVICPKGMRANVRRSDDRNNVSIMACTSANGETIPPLYIFEGVRKQMQWMDGCVPGSACAMSESSNINGKIFLHWLKWFKYCINTEEQVLLILDGHFAHIGLPTLEEAIKMNIDIFTLPPHCSHFLQPLDVVMYKVFKQKYEQELHNFPLHNKGALPDKSDIVKITAVPWKIAMTRKNIISAFEKTGIYPFSKEKMMESIIGDVPKQSRPLGLSLLCDDAFQLSERQVRYLKQRDIDPVKVNSVRIGLECWLGILKPVAKEKKERTFVSGPALMTSDEMVEHIRTKEEEKKRKKEDINKRKLERLNRKNEREEAKKKKKKNESSIVTECVV